jgi:hypothetical protein
MINKLENCTNVTLHHESYIYKAEIMYADGKSGSRRNHLHYDYKHLLLLISSRRTRIHTPILMNLSNNISLHTLGQID